MEPHTFSGSTPRLSVSGWENWGLKDRHYRECIPSRWLGAIAQMQEQKKKPEMSSARLMEKDFASVS